MYHLAAYFAAIGQTANTDIAALSDQVLSISNGHFRLVDNMQLWGAYVGSATLLRAKLDSPTIRIPGNPYVLPPNVGLTPISEPRWYDLSASPYQLPVREEIALLATSGLACGTENLYGLIAVTTGYVPCPPGRVQWVRLTSTTAAVASTWTTLTTTFETSLPSGYWSVVGLRGESTHGIAYRLIFPGQVWRPGSVAITALGNRQHNVFMDGTLGELGRFVNDNPFQVQVLNNTTDNAHEVYVGLVQVGSL